MSIKKDLTGKKFGRLLVISQAPSIARKNSNRKQIWNCAWNCLCDCGNTRIATTDKLNRGNIQSCGCLALENSKNPVMLSKLHESNREYHPRIASARRVLERYVRQDNGQCNIEFDEFYSISQMNCTYCGIEPSNKFNAFYDQPDNSYSKLEGTFCYSGLDRIDSSFPHISGNCVASCLICNVAKSDYTTKEFLSSGTVPTFSLQNLGYSGVIFSLALLYHLHLFPLAVFKEQWEQRLWLSCIAKCWSSRIP